MVTRSTEPSASPVDSADPFRHEMPVVFEVSTPWPRMSSLGSTAMTECRPRAARMRVQMPVPAPTSTASTWAGFVPTHPKIAVATCGA